MSADFWAGYISGAMGIIIGNPLDVLKVRLQASRTPSSPSPSPSGPTSPSPSGPTSPASSAQTYYSLASSSPSSSSSTLSTHLRPWITGTAAPVLGYGALNALLFVSYNRSEAALNRAFHICDDDDDGSATGANLWTTWLAGAIGGLATWVVSTPTELVKCRAQLASSPAMASSSWAVATQVLRAEGLRGLYFGGGVTALRDSVGYGFYFWSYELASRWVVGPPGSGQEGQGGVGVMTSQQQQQQLGPEAAKVLLCGGLAGIVTWASIFPLDVVKTRMQAQVLLVPPSRSGGGGSGGCRSESSPLLPASRDVDVAGGDRKRLGAWEIAKEAYREGGVKPFFRGLAVCSVRAFIVNAVQWAVYEWIMLQMGQGRVRRNVPLDAGAAVG